MSELTDKQKHTIKIAADLLRTYGGQRYARMADSLLGIVKSLEARRTQPEATKPAQDLSAAIRLRLVCKLLGLEGAVPEDDADLWGCAFSVLGMIRSKLEEQKPIGFVVQHDANGGNFFTGVTSFEGMRKTYGMAAKLVFGVPVNNLSNAILALPCKAEGSTLPLQQHYASGFRAALDAAAALASPADAMVAGDSTKPDADAYAKDARLALEMPAPEGTHQWLTKSSTPYPVMCSIDELNFHLKKAEHELMMWKHDTPNGQGWMVDWWQTKVDFYKEAINAAIQAQKDGQ